MPGLKILHVIWTARTGGIASVVLQLVQDSISKETDGRPAMAVMMGMKTGELLPDFIGSGVPLYDAGLKSGTDLTWSVYRRCKAVFDDFDILHFHSFNPLLAWAACRSSAKTVYTEHGNFGIGRDLKFTDVLLRYLQGRFLNGCVKAVTFNSEFTRRMSIDRFGLDRPMKRIIPNGIRPLEQPEEPATQFSQIKKDGILIAAVGRLASVKRFDRLIEAFASVSPRRSRLVILGKGPEKDRLDLMIKDSGMADRISIIDKACVHDLLEACDYCVLPSSGEAFGLVALEAYQHGKKVFVFRDGGGVTELVHEAEPDALVEDVAELGRRILECEDSGSGKPNEEQLIRARKEFAARYSIERMQHSLDQLYSEI